MKFFITMLIVINCFAQEIKELPLLSLENKKGGRLDGTSWSSAELKGKVFAFFYVDPDKKDLNEHVYEALRKENFSNEKFQSIAVINMAATWMPNFAIESSLKAKQKKYPKSLYLKDFKKTFVKEWNLTDDESNILIFNKEGKVIYNFSGKLPTQKIPDLIHTIRKNL